MPRAVDPARSDQLTHLATFQILACEIRVETDSQAIADRLRYVVQHATQEHEVTDRVTYEIAARGDEVLLREGDVVVATERNSDIVFEILFKRVHQRSFAALPDHIRIHAASGVHQGRMFLLVGNPHAGKTTLALALLAGGMQILGDELVVVRDGLAATYPRKFYPREASLDLVPTLKRLAPSLPRVYLVGGPRLAVDPLTFDRPWHIASHPVGAIFYLDPNFGSRTRLSPCSKIDMVRLVMEQCAPPASGRGGWIGDLCALVNGASTHMLALGDLDSAVTRVRDCLGPP